MEEIKRILEAIHKENKDILFILCTEGTQNTDEDIDNMMNTFIEIEEKYDTLFYGKDDINERTKN